MKALVYVALVVAALVVFAVLAVAARRVYRTVQARRWERAPRTWEECVTADTGRVVVGVRQVARVGSRRRVVATQQVGSVPLDDPDRTAETATLRAEAYDLAIDLNVNGSNA